MSNITTALRFAALIRVSTEQQERTGESLRTQHTQIEKDVHLLGGRIVAWYGGQEHGTPGWEKKEVDRLIADAGKAKFDAVIVANADRWSRDNTKSAEGLAVFKDHKVRFYVGVTEHDLFNPEHMLFLDMASAIGKFHASTQKKRSLLNRIHRSRSGIPTCGKLPFGRNFIRDDDKGRWEINAKQQAMIQDVAKRYLDGEQIPKLAEEYGVNPANLHKVLTKRCGDKWVQEFNSDELNIHEVIEISVPPLLPEETIRAIRQRAEANRTYHHGHLKYHYLLSRMVFCGHCGYAMFGQANHSGFLYYRHAHRPRGKKCGRRKVWVRADQLEEAVMQSLFDMFGNPVAVQNAIAEATLNHDEIAECFARRERIQTELAKVKTARERILNLVSREAITEDQAAKQLNELKGKEVRQRDELAGLEAELEHIPSPSAIKATAKKVVEKFKRIRYVDARLLAKQDVVNHAYHRMSWDQKRALAELVFGGRTSSGQRMGVHVEWLDGQEARQSKQWRFHAVGHLVDDWGRTGSKIEEFMGGPMQKELLAVTKSALYCTGRALR